MKLTDDQKLELSAPAVTARRKAIVAAIDHEIELEKAALAALEFKADKIRNALEKVEDEMIPFEENIRMLEDAASTVEGCYPEENVVDDPQKTQ